MDLSILTPHRKLVENETVEELFVPAFRGQLDILPGHANIVTELETGLLRWRSGSNWKHATISYGWLEIQDGHVTILSDVSELAEEIDLARAQKAEAVARQKADENDVDPEFRRKYVLKLRRAINRISATET